MDEQSTMNNEQVNSKPNRLQALAFLKVGLVEFGFVAVVLFLLFGTLNYFNILSVSDAFPKYLSWLPRREALTGTSQNFSAVPKTSPTPTDFQYDTTKAEALLTQYIKDNIKPEFLPAKIEIKEGLTIDGRIEDVKYEFGSRFTTNKDSFSINFHYKENTNDANEFVIFIQPETISDITATTSLANSLLASYFINPFLISNCQTKGTTSYCENFQALDDGKRGYGIVFGHERTKLIPIVFNCTKPKESKDYNKLNSCITP